MENEHLDNNKAVIIGMVTSDMVFSHEVYGEKFYSLNLDVSRLSETSDIIRATISERFFGTLYPAIGDKLLIKGQFRSYNNFSNIGNKLILTVFVKDIERVEDLSVFPNPNSIFLNGYVCKPPIYRTTPFQREIADILLAVNRSYNKSDYIPC
ncbi:MAG: single-stranded DNA-binding protein, partial [Oscillospiraceae bacterium]